MIQCAHVSKTYRNGQNETRALIDATFTIDAGEYVAIMGPSGSGKSTLMQILGCLDTPTEGTYHLDGRNVTRSNDDELADMRKNRIGFIFQAFNLLPRATVLRNVMLPLMYAGVTRSQREQRARAALKNAAFPEQFWNHYSNQLSGGMMQRVAIARALVNDPALILADEPTGNLDTKTGEHILSTFQHLNETEGRTIVLITHEPDVARAAGRIISLRDGAIVGDEINNSRRHIVQSSL